MIYSPTPLVISHTKSRFHPPPSSPVPQSSLLSPPSLGRPISHGFHCLGATCPGCPPPVSRRHPPPSSPNPTLTPTPDPSPIRLFQTGVSGDGGRLPAAGSAAAGGCVGGSRGADPEEGAVSTRVPLPSERAPAARARASASASAAEAEAERECGGRDAGVSRGDAARGGAGVARRAAAVEATLHVGARLRPQFPPRKRCRSSVPLNLPLHRASVWSGFSALLSDLIVLVT